MAVIVAAPCPPIPAMEAADGNGGAWVRAWVESLGPDIAEEAGDITGAPVKNGCGTRYSIRTLEDPDKAAPRATKLLQYWR